MWEGEPVGVDQKRPLVGFALVAVLCAVLMTVSVGQGWGVDIFRPGKPIAAPAEIRHRAPAHAGDARPVEHEKVTIPAELSAQPLGAAVPEPISKRVARATAQSQPEVTRSEDTQPEATQAPAPERRADRAAQRAERTAEKALTKLQRKADKAAAKAERKAAREAEKAAAAAARDAAKAAAQAERDAAKAVAAAARDAAKLARTEAHAAR
jgi:hypothetical protein